MVNTDNIKWSGNYEGNVAIAKNTQGKIVLRTKSEGKYNQSNVAELKSRMLQLAEEHNCTASIWTPNGVPTEELTETLIKFKKRKQSDGSLKTDVYLAMVQKGRTNPNRPTVEILE
tara:strand:+ start:600 stop:947 length:348 start_codon:yes stop_codon:yes gene_type:complete